jgi:hypothetical protein
VKAWMPYPNRDGTVNTNARVARRVRSSSPDVFLKNKS